MTTESASEQTVNTFYIYFWGLICHMSGRADPNTKIHASLANAPHHRPVLVFEGPREVPLTSNVTFPVGAGTASVADEFREWVPSLQRLLGAGADAKDEVISKNPRHGLHVDYPAGVSVELSVANLYKTFGQHIRGASVKPPRIVARVVVAIIKTTAASLQLHFTGATPNDKLTTNSPCLLVTNAEDRPGTNNDFKHYGLLLKANPDAGEMQDVASHTFEVPLPACDWVLDYIQSRPRRDLRAALSTECGNTQWP